MRLIKVIISAIMLSVLTSGSFAGAEDFLVLARPGELPIIITAPHGGSWSIPGIHPRTKGKVLKDENTFELAETLANRLQTILGTRPYLVAAKFSRKYIDANRKESIAYSESGAKPYYDEYHRRVRGYIADIRQKYPDGALLIDIHGQSSDNSAIYRGTRNGTTVDHLLNRYGSEALIGEKSVFGVLASRGYRVIPANDCQSEEAKYIGGYTVATYGSNSTDGIDSIQIEIGGNLRKAPLFVEDLATAIATFYKSFLDGQRK